MNEKRGLKFLIVGTGGIGGPVGAYLARAGKDVTFIARGAHLQAMRENGLRIVKPDTAFTIDPVRAFDMDSYDEKPDVIFVCVKGYSLEDSIPFLQKISDSHTVIIPLLNIFTTGRMLAKRLPGILVTDGCIYVSAKILEPGVIEMNAQILRVVFGVRDPGDFRDTLREVEQDLKESGVETILSDNIARDALLKFSYVSPAGACGLYYGVSAGEIQQPGEIRDCFVRLVREIDLLAAAMDIHFEEDIVERNLNILNALPPEATTSLQRDVAAGRPSEIDGLIYEIVRLGEEYGVPLPEYRKIADALRSK